MKLILIYAACWLGMVVLAILNGAIREKFYGQVKRELSAHQLSTFIVIILLDVMRRAAPITLADGGLRLVKHSAIQENR